MAPVPPRIFLLSPATCSGLRARALLLPSARSELASAIQSPDGATLGEVFTFLSGLYFRGKLTYAQTFARPPRRLSGRSRPKSEVRGPTSAQLRTSGAGRRTSDSRLRTSDLGLRTARGVQGPRPVEVCAGGVFVITPSRGLQMPDYPVTAGVLEEFAHVQIEAANPAYRSPLEAGARLIDELAGARTEVVLLGSIATRKYVDVLLDVFGDRLLFPADFVGRGDMSRGGLMLRCVRAGTELPYVPVRGAVRHGPRPPRLEPLGRP